MGKQRSTFRSFNHEARTCASAQVLPALRYRNILTFPPYCHGCRLKSRGPSRIEIIMRRLRVITFALLTTSIVSALQVSTPPTIVTVPEWTYRGCYTDSVASRTLTGKNSTGILIPRRCSSFCRGYKYFGLESSNE